MLSRASNFPLADEAAIIKAWNYEVHSLTTMEEREGFLTKVKDINSFTGYVQAVEKTIKNSNEASRLLKSPNGSNLYSRPWKWLHHW